MQRDLSKMPQGSARGNASANLVVALSKSLWCYCLPLEVILVLLLLWNSSWVWAFTIRDSRMLNEQNNADLSQTVPSASCLIFYILAHSSVWQNAWLLTMMS